MTKMKLSLTIMSAVIIFVIIGITSCSKSEFGLDESETQNIESVPVSTDAVLSQANIVSVKENYTDEETGITGTMYEIENADGTVQQILKVEKYPTELDEPDKGWLIRRASMSTWESGGMVYFGCIGYQDFNCAVLFDKITIAW